MREARRVGAAGRVVQGQRFRTAVDGLARDGRRQVGVTVPRQTEAAEEDVLAKGPGYAVRRRDGYNVQELLGGRGAVVLLLVLFLVRPCRHQDGAIGLGLQLHVW